MCATSGLNEKKTLEIYLQRPKNIKMMLFEIHKSRGQKSNQVKVVLMP